MPVTKNWEQAWHILLSGIGNIAGGSGPRAHAEENRPVSRPAATPSLLSAQDSPTNKLLYAKEIPEYRKIVQRYYKQIHDMTPLSEQEMNAHLAEESRVRPVPMWPCRAMGGGPGLACPTYQNEFNTNVAMTEIYKYAKRYRSQIMTALEANPTARRTQLQHKFEQVVALMEDNIYECYSEA
ncbi:hypothetical protein MC885_004879 [Smutsia gigantea]|nr:hypothetical protein MC885_004879 [Smutsia gigantea]